MNSTYVIADLHGRIDLLEGALIAIELIEAQNQYRVVFLGDYCDRGPNSCEVFERLIRGPKSQNAKWICLKGNHEAMLSFCENNTGEIAADWMERYGNVTLKSYPDGKVPSEHIAWINSLPLYHTDAHRIYVHAGLKPDVALENQIEHDVLWYRYPKGYSKDYMGKHIVHGHTANQNGPERVSGRTNFDTMAWKTGRLVVGCFDDGEAGGPLTFFEIISPQGEN